MNGLGIGDCLKRFLCCFPRVYAWFFAAEYDYARQRPSWNVNALGNDYAETYDANQYCSGYSQATDRRTPPASGYINGITFDSQDDWKFVAGCGIRSYGIKHDGSLWGWGEGALGDGTVEPSAVPILISESRWKSVSAGFDHTLAVKEDGTLWAWGMNDWGQLGDGCSTKKVRQDIDAVKSPNVFGWSYAQWSQVATNKFRAKISSSVASVTMQSEGEYSATPTVRFVIQNGQGQGRDSYGAGGAAGVAKMSYSLHGEVGPNFYRICTIEDAGSGYTHVPSVRAISASPPKSEPEFAIRASFSVISVEVSDGGQGYTSAPSLSVYGLAGFSATPTVEGGRIVSVALSSGGQGYKKTSRGDSGPARVRVDVSGGGGSGAVLFAVLGNGFIDRVEIVSGGDGFSQPPSLEVHGGGGTGARVSSTSKGRVVGVRVTNGGSEYTSIENGFPWAGAGVHQDYVIAVEFDRQPGDIFSLEAKGHASIEPSRVTPVLVDENFSSLAASLDYFNPDDGTLGAFSVSYVTAPGNLVTAKIIGGGLTWETGIQLTYANGQFAYNGTGSHQFTDRPYVQFKIESPRSVPPSSQISTYSVLPGTNPGEALEGVVQEEWHGYCAPRGCYASGELVVPGKWYGLYATRSGDLISFANDTIKSRVAAEGVSFGSPYGEPGCLTGSPGISFTADAQASLLINFEGICTFVVDDQGSKAVQWKLEESTGTTMCTYFNQDDPTRCKHWNLTTEVQTAVYDTPPDRLRPDLSQYPHPTLEVAQLTGDFGFSPVVSFATAPVPDSSWQGAKSVAGRLYAVFGAGRDQGCFEILPTGPRVVREGGYFTKEPMCRVVYGVCPEMRQVSGTWKTAEATSSGNWLSAAVDGDGDVWRWGFTGGLYQPHLGSQRPASIGRPAVLSVTWNADAKPGGGFFSYWWLPYIEVHRSTLSGAVGYSLLGTQILYGDIIRFVTVGGPESPGGQAARINHTSRRCDSYRFYPDEVPKNLFVTGPPSDEKGPTDVSMERRAAKPFLDQFTSTALTSFFGGSGYYSPPFIQFLAHGNPLVSVSADLKEVPPFADFDFSSSLALTDEGELWSLSAGYRIVADDPKIIARKASASASSLFDSVIAGTSTRSIPVKTKEDVECPPSKETYVAGPHVYVNRPFNFFPYGSAPAELWSDGTTSVSHESVDSVDVVVGHLIFLDDGGSGFDSYSDWVMRVHRNDTVSITAVLEETTFGNDRATLGGFTQTNAYKQAVANKQAYDQCVAVMQFPEPNEDSYKVPPYTAQWVRNSWSHVRQNSIARTPNSFVDFDFSTWMGSLIPDDGNLLPAFGRSNCFWVPGVSDADEELEIEFVCISGNSSYGSLPAYRVIPVYGSIDQDAGQCKVDGSWSDFTIQGGSRRLGVVAVEGCQGLMAPGEEANFVKVHGSVGLKSDGSLWRLGAPGVSPSRVMGNLELKVASPGKGYRAPVLAEISQQHAGVAKASATFDGKVVAVGIDNQGSGYRAPPQLTVSGGAQLQAVILGPVDSVTVTDGGSGYKNPPRVIFSTPGVSASGKASMTGSVSSVWVVDGGEGYATPPSISMGGDATATATIKGYVQSVIVNGGGLYSSAPTVNFSGGGGSGATAVAVMTRSGDSLRVSSVVVTNSGTGYTSSPAVSFSGDGSGATATSVLNAAIDSVSLTSGGSEYTDHPTVAADGPATRTATLAAMCSLEVDSVSVVDGGSYRSAPTASFEAVGEISSVSLTSGGSGYSSAPEVKILGGLGAGAEAACTISASIQDFVVTDGGSGYQYPPYVLITGGRRPSQSTQAKATAVISGGVVSAISVDSEGSGYYEQPTVAFKFPVSAIADASVSNGSVSGVSVRSGGCWYTDPPEVVFEGAGMGATATAQVQDGVITSVNVTNGGSGYSTPPKVNFVVPKGGRGAQAAAVLSGEVDSIKLVSCGVNYDQDALPEVLFIGGGGSGASASISVAKSGSGGSATTTINGSVIYAKIIDQGSGYQDEPTVTVSESTNFILQKASEDYANGLISQEEYDETRGASAAVVRAGIAGEVTGVAVDSGGGDYVPGSGRLHDQHGKRKPSRAVLRGPTTLPAAASGGSGCFCGVADSLTSSSEGGGGSITSITPPSDVNFVRRPSVHFSDSVGASICTRLKVSSAGVRKGSGMDVTRFDAWGLPYFSDMGIPSYDESPAAKPFLAFLGNSVESPYGGTRDWRGCGQIPDAHRGMKSEPVSGMIHSHDITCNSFNAKFFSGRYVRPPRLGIESSKGERQEWDLAANVSYDQEFSIPGSSKHSSDVVGFVADPGVVEIVSPQFQVTISGGSVSSVTATGPAKADWIWGYGDLVVHGGGGTGAKLSISISGESMTVYVVEGGSGYKTTPSVKWVLPEKSYGPRTLTDGGYSQTYPLTESRPSFPAIYGIVNVSGGVLVEYITGSTGDGYISTRGDYPISQVGIYPFFKDGFVSDAYLMDAGYPTQDFDGPAFLKHYTSPPPVTLYGASSDEQASVQASVVQWTDKFSGKGGLCLAVRDTSP